MTEIKGIIAAMQTAMHEDGSINEAELRRQINRQIAAGVDAVFCLGTNGEFYIMSMEEKIRVMEIFVDEVKGRVPVYAGTGCISTAETVALSKKAEEIGKKIIIIRRQLKLLSTIMRPSARRSSTSTTQRWRRLSAFRW